MIKSVDILRIASHFRNLEMKGIVITKLTKALNLTDTEQEYIYLNIIQQWNHLRDKVYETASETKNKYQINGKQKIITKPLEDRWRAHSALLKDASNKVSFFQLCRIQCKLRLMNDRESDSNADEIQELAHGHSQPFCRELKAIYGQTSAITGHPGAAKYNRLLSAIKH